VESGDGYGRDIALANAMIMANPKRRQRFRFTPILEHDRRTLNPLQAADMLAYETFKEMANSVLPGKELRPVRKLQIALLKNLSEKAVWTPREEFEEGWRALHE
jgi:hypothetical protein